MQKWMLSVVVLVLIAPQASVAEQLTLTTGETLKVRIIDRSEQSVTLQHPILGQLTIERSHIVTLAETASDRQPVPDTPRADSVNQPAQQDPAAGMAPGSTLAPLLHSRDWQFEIGLSGSDGNSQTTNLRLGFTGVHNNTDGAFFFFCWCSHAAGGNHGTHVAVGVSG